MPHITNAVPTAFIWRRVHSLMGFWLVLFLCEHLLINAQAALWFGGEQRFILLVNFLQSIPGLKAIEAFLIGTPILVHLVWGIKRASSAKTNSWRSDGSKPSLPYVRNLAFTWQRVTAWILVIGVVAHVIQIRWVDYPKKAFVNHQERELVRISRDPDLDALAAKLRVSLFSAAEIKEKELLGFSLNERQVVAAAPDHGTAILLTVRDMFKNPIMQVLYTIFILAAVFHAFNGFWTFLLTWGLIVSAAAQKAFHMLGFAGMIVFALLGLIAIWMR